MFWFAKHCAGFTWLRWNLHGPIAYAWQAPNGTKWLDQYGREHEYDRFRAAVIPRGHLKTSLCTQAYGMWRVVNNPDERILIYTAHYNLASEIMNYIRTTFEGGGKHGQFFLQLFGSIVPSSADRKKWGTNDLTLNREGAYSDPTFKGRGVGSTVTGGHHTLQLIDDLVGKEMQKPEMAKVLRDFDNLDPLYHSLALGERRFVGTPWAWFDPISYITKYWPEAMVARIAWRKLNERGEPKGELIYPVIPGHEEEFGGCDLAKAESIFARNAWFGSCQYNVWPKDEGKIGFNRGMFKYFRQRGDYFYEIDSDGKEQRRTAIADCNTFILIDPNTGREEAGKANADVNMPVASSHDYAAWVVVCVDRDNRWFIPRVLRWRCNIDEFVDKTHELVSVWKPKKVCIETRGAQIFLLKVFKDSFKLGREPFVMDDWEGGNATKPARIKALIPYYSNGMVLHRDADNVQIAQGISELEGELIDFGGTMEHDDASDALSAAVKKVYAPGRDGPTLADEKKDLAYEAQIASLDVASRRAARAWKNRTAPDTNEWFSEGYSEGYQE